MLTSLVLLLSSSAVFTHGASTPPTIEQLGGDWIDLTKPVSEHVTAADLDLPVISNFWGSAGSSGAGLRPVDLFSVNSLNFPPFCGCGATTDLPNGCGRLLINGKQVEANAIRYQADQVSRRSAWSETEIVVSSETRMPFEQSGVLWKFNLTNPTAQDVTPAVTFELNAMMEEHAHVSSLNNHNSPYNVALH